MERQLPNLVIIGAQKCATSSLHRYLDAHPDIFMSEQKELDFFIEERQWSLGLDWYRARFRSPARIRGESSPNYTAFPVFGGVAKRMHSVIPDARLIYVVRDPIERMLSHYAHAVDRHTEKRPVEEALLDPDSGYLARSRYFMQLSQFLQYYDRPQFLVVDYSQLASETSVAMRSIFAFLGVDSGFSSPLFEARFHGSADKRRLTLPGAAARRLYRLAKRVAPAAARLAKLRSSPLLSQKIGRPVLTDSARRTLQERLADDAGQLRALTGLALASWSV